MTACPRYLAGVWQSGPMANLPMEHYSPLCLFRLIKFFSVRQISLKVKGFLCIPKSKMKWQGSCFFKNSGA